ncbi:DUF2332 domain-containing protein [Sphaerotilaceae bacterium SBD11-9]
MDAATTSRLAARFGHFAEAECPEEPLYAALCRIVAADPELLDLLAGASDEQQRPNLWLAAVHDRLLAGAGHPLAAYFPSVGGTRAPDAQLADCVRSFVASHEAALRERMRTQTTQTNEIGRCAVLWPALQAIALRTGNSKLALLDLGCSAGLNLGVDAYRYDEDGGAAADVPVLPCRRVGPQRPPQAELQIVARLGIDPAPVDVRDETAVRWLRACLWPSNVARMRRFDAAIALARRHAWPVRRESDCSAAIAPWLDSLPADVQPVLFNSWVLTYFERPALQRHVDTVTSLVRERGLVWLSAEGADLRIGPVAPPPPAEDSVDARRGSLWTLCSRVDGKLRFDLLARSHPHGRWMEWLAG